MALAAAVIGMLGATAGVTSYKLAKKKEEKEQKKEAAKTIAAAAQHAAAVKVKQEEAVAAERAKALAEEQRKRRYGRRGFPTEPTLGEGEQAGIRRSLLGG